MNKRRRWKAKARRKWGKEPFDIYKFWAIAKQIYAPVISGELNRKNTLLIIAGE